MLFLIGLVGAVAIGVLAQKWKGRTGALWGFLTALLVLGFQFMFGMADTGMRMSGEYERFSPTVHLITDFTLTIMAPLGIMGLIVATLPRKGGAMTCPRCAERIQAAARVCRHCGHSFEPSPCEPAARSILDAPRNEPRL